MKRRSFFQSLTRTAAILALAPQIAFRVKPESFGTVDGRFLCNTTGIYEQLKACENVVVREPLDLQAFFRLNYDIIRARQQAAGVGDCNVIERWMEAKA